MPTIGNTPLPYYHNTPSLNEAKPAQAQLQTPTKPITVLKAEPPPSVELTEAPALDLKTEIDKPQGISLDSLEAPELAPTSIETLNANELQELESLGSSAAIEGIEYGSEAPSSAISQLSTSLNLNELSSFEDTGTIHRDTDQVAVNINQSHRGSDQVAVNINQSDRGTNEIGITVNNNHRETEQTGITVNNNHQVAGL